MSISNSDIRALWQAKCLKSGFDYVRESDDHYVMASHAEMAELLGDLLGIEVRSKDNHSYGETVSQLRGQLDQANAAFMRAYAAEKEAEGLRKDAERYRWLRDKAQPADWEFIGGQTPDAGEAEIDAAMAKERT